MALSFNKAIYTPIITYANDPKVSTLAFDWAIARVVWELGTMLIVSFVTHQIPAIPICIEYNSVFAQFWCIIASYMAYNSGLCWIIGIGIIDALNLAKLFQLAW